MFSEACVSHSLYRGGGGRYLWSHVLSGGVGYLGGRVDVWYLGGRVFGG